MRANVDDSIPHCDCNDPSDSPHMHSLVDVSVTHRQDPAIAGSTRLGKMPRRFRVQKVRSSMLHPHALFCVCMELHAAKH